MGTGKRNITIDNWDIPESIDVTLLWTTDEKFKARLEMIATDNEFINELINDSNYKKTVGIGFRPCCHGEYFVPAISKVIFNGPATIAFWADGTKTVVKSMPGETYSKDVGLSLCFMKKMLGCNFHRELHRWTREVKDE